MIYSMHNLPKQIRQLKVFAKMKLYVTIDGNIIIIKYVTIDDKY